MTKYTITLEKIAFLILIIPITPLIGSIMYFTWFVLWMGDWFTLLILKSDIKGVRDRYKS